MAVPPEDLVSFRDRLFELCYERGMSIEQVGAAAHEYADGRWRLDLSE